ncbi:MAG TPA: hypothetical protein VNG33_18570 [Polyangiaceae bacterium]|nr:hypothetical protein [Polyangiaceae bacterium]
MTSKSSRDPGALAENEARGAPPKERAGLVVRPGLFLTAVILSAFGAGLAIYWLLRSMHI